MVVECRSGLANKNRQAPPQKKHPRNSTVRRKRARQTSVSYIAKMKADGLLRATAMAVAVAAAASARTATKNPLTAGATVNSVFGPQG